MTILWEETRETLRKQADSMLGSLTPQMEQAHPNEVFLHELLVHKVELEMQNEELRRAHIALEEARDRYVDLYEFAPVGYVTITREGVISEINLTGCSLLGMRRSQLIDHRFAQLISPQDSDRWHRRFISMMKDDTPSPCALDLQMHRADGTIFQAQIDCQRTGETSKIASVLRVALTDISKLKQAETEAHIAAIAFESADGMLITDADKVILRVNRSLLDTTGYKADELIGKNPCLLQSDRHPADFYISLWDSAHHTGRWQGEVWNKRKNDETYPAHLTLSAVEGPDGQVTNYVAAYRDVNMNGNTHKIL